MAHKYTPVPVEEETTDLTSLPLDKPVAVYYRQSTSEQVGNVSTAIQTVDLPEQLKRRGWKAEQIIAINADAGVSGTLKINEREGMSRLFDMILNKEIGTVATVDEDRLFRDVTMIQADTFIDACKQNGVYVYTPTVIYIFHHPTMGHFYVKQFRMKCEQAADYIESFVKQRLGGARHRIRLAGKWAGQPIYGYIADMRDRNSPTYRNLVPFEPFAEAVRTIFQTFVECGTGYFTRRALIERGFKLPTVADYPLPPGFKGNYKLSGQYDVPSDRMLRDLVTNVMYRGDYVYRGAVIRRGNHPAIVSDELFNAAYNLANPISDDGSPNPDYVGRFQRRAPDEHRRTIERPLLEGRLWVKMDGEFRQGRVMYRSEDRRYDYTARRRDLTYPAWIRASNLIDNAVKHFLKQRLLTTAVRETLKDSMKAQEVAREAELKRLALEIKATERRIEGMATKIVMLTDNALLLDLENRYTAMRGDYQQLIERRDKLQRSASTRVQREVFAKLMEWAQEDVLPLDAARQLTALLIRRVEVLDYDQYGDIKVVIRWNDAEPTHFDLPRSSSRGWDFSEIETLKYYSGLGASQIVLSAVLPGRTMASIRAQARRMGLNKIAPAGVREEEAFEAYLLRQHGLQIYSKFELVPLGEGKWHIHLQNIETDEMGVLDCNGVHETIRTDKDTECRQPPW